MKLFNSQLSVIVWKGTRNLNQRKKNENLETRMFKAYLITQKDMHLKIWHGHAQFRPSI